MSKNILKSKTFWLQAITVGASFVPQVQVLIATSPETVAAVIGAVNVLMRFATSGKVSLT